MSIIIESDLSDKNLVHIFKLTTINNEFFPAISHTSIVRKSNIREDLISFEDKKLETKANFKNNEKYMRITY
jgi:hypothetical protein